MKLNTIVLLAVSVIVFFVMLAGIDNTVFAQARPTNDMIQGFIKDYLRSQGKSKYPMQVIGMGSWISNTNYKDPLNLAPGKMPSDHDMRLVIPDDMPADQAIKKWKEFQQFMRKKIASNFPAGQVDTILNSVTIYPPEQLIANLDSNSQVMDYFKNVLNGKPNLGSEPIEGFFGRHNHPFRQNYERMKGRLFYLDGKNVVKTTTDLQHAAEGGLTPFTTSNQARSAQDAIDHALDLAKKNDVDGTIKHMSRVEQALKKAKDLKRIPHNSNIDEVIKKLKELPPGDIPSDLLEQIKTVLKNADTEAKLLQNLDHYMSRGAMKEAQLLIEMLTPQSSSLTSSMRGKLWELASNIPADKFLKVVEVGLVSYDVYDAVQSASQEEYDKAYRSALLGALGAAEVGLLPLAPAIIADMFLDYVKAKGYTMIAAMQDCEFLMAGICNATGRAQETIEKPMRDYSPQTVFDNDQPVNTNEYIKVVQNHLQIMAHHCSVRGSNSKDRKIEEALYDRCLAQLIKEWNEYRIKKMGEVSKLELDFLKKIENTTLGLNAKPNPAKLPKTEEGKKSEVKVSVKAHYYYDKASVSRLYDSMNTLFKKFGGSNNLTYIRVKTTYRWKVDGQEVSNKEDYYSGGNTALFNEEEATKDLIFDTPGDHKVDFDFIVEIQFVAQYEVEMVNDFIEKLFMNQTITKSASITITVEDAADDDKDKDDSNKEPDDQTQQPDDQTQQPDDQTQQPDDQTKQPDDQTQQPDDQTQQPDDQSQQPDDQTQQPDDQTQQPDDQTQQPDDQKQKPDDQTQKPDDISQNNTLDTTSKQSNSEEETIKSLLIEKAKILEEAKALAQKWDERTKKSQQIEKNLLREWDIWQTRGYSGMSSQQNKLSDQEFQNRYPKVYEARKKAKHFNECLKTFRKGDQYTEQRTKDITLIGQIISKVSMNDAEFKRSFPNVTGPFSIQTYLQKKRAEIDAMKNRSGIYEVTYPSGCIPTEITDAITPDKDKSDEKQSEEKPEEKITATITGLSSKEYYGSKKSIAVKITSNSKGTISSVLWDSSPNLSFNPKESSGLNSSVTFDRMQNPTRIWADVSIGAEDVMDLRLSGEIGELEEYSPKGATKVSIEPQEVEVVSPEFTFNYEPSAFLGSRPAASSAFSFA